MSRKKCVSLWRLISVSAIVLVALVLSTCGSQSPTAEFPVGTFSNGSYWDWEFNSDGTYFTEGPGASERGTYTVTGDQIVIEGDYCEDVKGTYTWSYDGKELNFAAPEDDRCTPRRAVVLSGPWVKEP
jgi:redox-sensitive bicupin YhaK (pirin superfamily)